MLCTYCPRFHPGGRPDRLLPGHHHVSNKRVAHQMPQRHHVRVAAVQPRGYPFDSPAAVEHVCAATAEAAANGAELVIFPEAFVGGYPWGLAFGTAVGGRKPAGRRTFGRYHDAAIPVPGPETERMGRAAASGGVYLAAGVIEKGAAHSPTRRAPRSTVRSARRWRARCWAKKASFTRTSTWATSRAASSTSTSSATMPAPTSSSSASTRLPRRPWDR